MYRDDPVSTPFVATVHVVQDASRSGVSPVRYECVKVVPDVDAVSFCHATAAPASNTIDV